MTLEQLDDLDAAHWKRPWADLDDEFEEPERDLNRVLTLRRLLETVRDYDRVVDLAIETKHPTRYGGLVEKLLVDLLDEFGWAGPDSPARVMSFSGVALSRVQRLAPDLEVVLLIESSVSWKVVKGMLRPGWIAGPGIKALKAKPRLQGRLQETGNRIHVWIVNDKADLERCLELGVEAVITDRPGHMLSLLGGV